MSDVVCCLTPPGVAALAVVAFRGPTVWGKLAPYFIPTTKFPTLSLHSSLSFGRLQRDELGDDVVLTLQGDEQQQTIEVQTHGGPGVVDWLLRLAANLGCRSIGWEDWLRSHCLPDTPNPELWSHLPHAITKRTAAILLDQCQGAFEREIARLRSTCGEPHHTLEDVRRLLRWEPLGQHLVRPWKVVLAGAPNAGKSSLFNALLGYERAITAPAPGTTRDLVSATLVWHGFAFELIDTAGLRDAGDSLEAEGVRRAVQSQRQADLLLWLVDLSDPRPLLATGVQPTFVVGTKADLSRRYAGVCDYPTSSSTGDGLPQLLDALLRRVLPEEPPPGQAVPVLQQQRDALTALEASLLRRVQSTAS